MIPWRFLCHLTQEIIKHVLDNMCVCGLVLVLDKMEQGVDYGVLRPQC